MVSSLKITRALIRRKRPSFDFTVYHDSPVTPLSRQLHECKLALITTGGLHLKTDRPFDLTIKDGDCSYRILPGSVSREDIGVSHTWYNHKFIHADLNCVFPIDVMGDYVREGKIRSLSGEHYSFMGHIYDATDLIPNAKKVGNGLKKRGVDIAFLTPT